MQEVVAKMDDTLNQLRDHQQGAIAITRSSPFADDGVRYHHIDHERDARGRRNCSMHGRVQILNDKAVVFPMGIRPALPNDHWEKSRDVARSIDIPELPIEVKNILKEKTVQMIVMGNTQHYDTYGNSSYRTITCGGFIITAGS
ncbi:predicted protein [Lichtheimia corymbifera JMRC:FSU:9682]|uniref:Uncharacterized protein n=1 Tax=Lichtheimia corymbifera JMRC:FSU:9682 TaxID=1263082 RepID=A0A068SAI0_9FUNG|nr:predicted protein [Lichtheimia corymbifera JMRC:FSU:9682]